MEITYHSDRLKYPMRRVGERGEGKFERISWDQALDTIAARLKDIADRYGWRAVGWVLEEQVTLAVKPAPWPVAGKTAQRQDRGYSWKQ